MKNDIRPKSIRNNYIKQQRSYNSSRAKWYTYTQDQKRSQVMEVLGIGFYSKTLKLRKMVFVRIDKRRTN